MAVDMSGKHESFINRSVSIAVQFKAAYDAWTALREEWDELDYTNAITDADFAEYNKHMNAVTLKAFYTSQGNLTTYWNEGNSTNISAVLP